MKYYKLLNFKKRPFANIPDREMFFKSAQHLNCLQRLELAVRLQRGLSVVIGKTGIGKTTLSRQLLQQLTTEEQRIQARLILDPQCGSALEFLQAMSKNLGLPADNESTEQQLKGNIKKYLEQTSQRGGITALIIDDGQTLPKFTLEILDAFLTLETKRKKLLQIVIFAGESFNLVLQNQADLASHIAVRVNLRPFSLGETKQMIAFRLSRSHQKSNAALRIFSQPAVLLIYLLSGGCPRRIVTLCSRLIIALLIKNKQRAGAFDLLYSLKGNTRMTRLYRKGLIIILALSGTAIILSPEIFHRPAESGVRQSILRVTPARAAGTKPIPVKTETAVKPVKPVKSVKSVKQPKQLKHRTLKRKKRQTASLPIRVEPAILGKLQVHRGDTLSKMIARVYGRCTEDRLRLVRKANKVLSSGKLLPGTVIKFPGTARVNFQPAAHEFWLQLGIKNTLQTAVNVLKAYPTDAPPIIIVPARRSPEDKTITFMIVLEKRFKKKSAATAVLKSLPSNLRKQAVIRHQ
ncbi:AAA family ATPase [Desulfobacterota bacterium M19]